MHQSKQQRRSSARKASPSYYFPQHNPTGNNFPYTARASARHDKAQVRNA
jgi:hypothetical protein